MIQNSAGGWVLAQYDFRSKQRFIYRTSRIREIAGASALITDAYESFVSCLIKEGWHIERHYKLKEYPDHRYVNSVEDGFKPDLEKNDGEILYVGGGNLYMLWRNRETALKANRILSRLMREETYDLSPVCGLADYTGDYAADLRNLRNDFAKCRNYVPPIVFNALLPFVQVDRKTNLPIVEKRKQHGDITDLSMESLRKLTKYETIPMRTSAEEQLDSMVTEKGRESLLACIHIDGNGIGARVRETMSPGGKTISDYSGAIRRIRELSNEIQEAFVSRPRAAIEEWIEKKHAACRFVIAGGDDMTLICNARHALQIVQIYFDTLIADGKSGNTACAGICVFHSHYPFSTAYAIAEECCENAKKANRAGGGGGMYVDFQHCFGGNIGSLESVRSIDRKDLILRPYRYAGGPEREKDGTATLEEYMARAKKLSGLGRSNVKNLSQRLVNDDGTYEPERIRLQAQFPQIRIDAEDRKYLHDIAQFYDIWMGKEE